MLGTPSPQSLATDPWEEPHPFRHPARWLVIAAVTGLGVGGMFMTWGTILGFEKVTLSGSSNGDYGFSTFLVSLGLLALVGSRQAAASRTRIVQLAPAVAGVAVLLLAIPGLSLTQSQIRDSQSIGHAGTFEPGFYVEGVSALLAAVGGIATTVVISRSHRIVHDTADRIAVDREFVFLVVVAVLGIGLGWWLASLAAGSPGDSLVYAGRMEVLGILGIFLGPAVTVTTARLLIRVARRRRG